jgi:hypothetical protein
LTEVPIGKKSYPSPPPDPNEVAMSVYFVRIAAGAAVRLCPFTEDPEKPPVACLVQPHRRQLKPGHVASIIYMQDDDPEFGMIMMNKNPTMIDF